MKKYIADALTALRLIATVALIVLTYRASPPEWALWVFVAGELTDAFDGIAARRWPFDPAHIPAYRQYAELYDMVTDVGLGLAALAYIIFRIDAVIGFIIAAITIESGIDIELLVWGCLFGSPKRHHSSSYWKIDREFSRTLILIRRRLYLVVIAVVILLMLFATNYSLTTKKILVGIGIVIGMILLIIKQNRLREVKTK